jgi:Flp pilus assembly protein TadG
LLAGSARQDALGMRNLAKFFRRCSRVVGRFRAAQRGTTAVEFAIIAPAFLALLIAVFETTIFLFAQSTLQNAAVQAGRLIMTGNVQTNNVTQSQFAADVCPMVSAVFTCSNLMINVQSYSSFSAASGSTGAPTLTYNANGTVSNTWSYDTGNPGSIMVVQLVYQWPIVSGPFGYVLQNLGNSKAEMMGVSVFRVEPY